MCIFVAHHFLDMYISFHFICSRNWFQESLHSSSFYVVKIWIMDINATYLCTQLTSWFFFVADHLFKFFKQWSSFKGPNTSKEGTENRTKPTQACTFLVVGPFCTLQELRLEHNPCSLYRNRTNNAIERVVIVGGDGEMTLVKIARIRWFCYVLYGDFV